jgi:hypothetical protein
MKIKKQNKSTLICVMGLFSLINACKEDPPKPPINENELITTMLLEFEDSITSARSNVIFKDADGIGGNAPSRFDTIRLSANRTYTCSVYLLDESKNPVDTVSNEVKKEGDEHLFVFTPFSVNISSKATDKDVKMLPIGLISTWRTGNSSTGKMKITLKHQPGVKDGTPGPGETDAEVNFNCTIQ